VFILIDGIHKVIEKLQDPSKHVRRMALDCVKTACVQGVIFCNLTASKFYYFSDNMRTTFISINGVQKIIEKLEDPDKSVQWTALDCIKTVCLQGNIFCNFMASEFYHFSDDIRKAFISINGVQKVLEKLQDLDVHMRQTALDCIQTLCIQGIIFYNSIASELHQSIDDFRTTFISINGVKEVLEKLQDLDKNVQKTALDCAELLCQHGVSSLTVPYFSISDISDQALSILTIQPNRSIIVQMLKSEDNHPTIKLFLASVLSQSASLSMFLFS
jgi:hypothetical protein